MDQCPGNDQTALHPARKGVGEIVLPAGQPEQLKQFVNAPPVFFRLHGMEPGMQFKVFPGGQVAVQAVLLRDHADLPADLSPLQGGIQPGHKGLARGGPHQGGQYPDEGSLAGAVRSEQGEDGAALHLQVEGVKCSQGAVAFGNGTGDDGGVGFHGEQQVVLTGICIIGRKYITVHLQGSMHALQLSEVWQRQHVSLLAA